MQKTGFDPTWLRLFDSFEEAVVLLQPNGEVLHANRACLHQLRLGAHEVIGRSFTDFLTPADSPQLDRALRHGVAGEPSEAFDASLRSKDGQIQPMTLRLSRLQGPGNPPWPMMLVLRNAEAARTGEVMTRLLASIVDGSEDAIIAKELDGTITSWNAAAVALFGYTPEQAIGRPITMLFPLERLAEEAEIMARIRRGEKVRHFEARRLARDGTVLDLSITVSPIHDAAGRVVGASKIARDMRQERLRANQLTVLASVYENCGEAIMILNAHGEFVEVNDAFTAITGYQREDMIGLSFNAFRSGRQSPREARRMIRDLRRQHLCKGEIWTRRKDGSALAGFLTVTALPGAVAANRFIAILADVTSLRLQQEKLDRLAHHDDLTGLPNRLLVLERLDQALVQAQGQSQEVTVAYLDMDGFKAVNDRHGHDAGDEILCALALRMTQCLLPTDTVARVGGDEFVLILPHLRGRVDRGEVLDALLATISRPIRRADHDITLTASIGVATCPPDMGGPEQLMRLADQAMYEAKRLGGNQIRFFDSARQAREVQHRLLVARVQAALAEGQLELHFQPQVNLASGAIVGAEALLRWMHPVEGLKLPGAFLPPLLDQPIIEEIGAQVISRAMEAIPRFAAAGLRLPVSINVTARELRRSNFAAFLRCEAARCKVEDRSLMRLELLETATLDEDPQIARTLAQCHEDGFGLAIDDFGVGFASLSYLGRIPADTIKLDRSFVMRLETDEASVKIALAVSAMAQAFGKSMVAEGVEAPGAAQLLLAMGCQIAQGFAIAPAMPFDHFLRWATQWNARIAAMHTPFVDSDLLEPVAVG